MSYINTSEMMTLCTSRQVTVDEYDRMLLNGLINEGAPFELIQGLILPKDRSTLGEDKMTLGNPHKICTWKLVNLTKKLDGKNCFIQIQGSITIPPYDKPEPDGAIIRGEAGEYLERDTTSEDISCIFEISDSSLRVDRTVKYAVYASAGIRQYIIVNLVENQLELFEQPNQATYSSSRIIKSGENIGILLPDRSRININADELLLGRIR